MILFQLHKGTSWFSKIIRWFSRSHYSHVSIWFYNPNDPHLGEIYEAWEGEGVRKVLGSQYQEARNEGKINLYTYKEPTALEQKEAMREALEKELGRPYDYHGVLKFVSRRRHAANDAWFCSEYAAYGSRVIGRPFFERTEDWELKPSDIPRSTLLEPFNI